MEPTGSRFSIPVLTQDEQALRWTSREGRLLRVSGGFKTLVRHELCARLGTSFSICLYHAFQQQDVAEFSSEMLLPVYA